MSAPSDRAAQSEHAVDVRWRTEALSEAAWTRLARILFGSRNEEPTTPADADRS